MEESSSIGDLLTVDSNTTEWATNITGVNESHIEISFYKIMFYTMTLLYVIIGLVGMVGNAIVLWFLGFRTHRNAFSVYILNLAVADFLFMSFHILQIIVFYFKDLDTSKFLLVALNFAYLCGLSMLSAISLERSLSVIWPIWYHCQRPRHTSAVICTLLWFLSLLLSLLEGMGCGLIFNITGPGWCQMFDFITAAWLIVLFVVLLGSSLALVVTIFCGSNRIPVTRLYVTIVCTVLVFLLFGLPYGINWFLFDWIANLQSLNFYLYPITKLLSSLNSCANPIIYFLVGCIRNRRFQRNTLKVILQRAIKDTAEEEDCGEGDSSGRSREMKTVWQN